jgi:hypothetical protein
MNHFRDKKFFIKKNELQLLLGRNKNLVGWSRSLIFKMEQVHLKHSMDCIKYTSASNIWEKWKQKEKITRKANRDQT